MWLCMSERSGYTSVRLQNCGVVTAVRAAVYSVGMGIGETVNEGCGTKITEIELGSYKNRTCYITCLSHSTFVSELQGTVHSQILKELLGGGENTPLHSVVCIMHDNTRVY